MIWSTLSSTNYVSFNILFKSKQPEQQIKCFLVDVVADPVALLEVAKSLRGTRDPGILYRRMRNHLDSLETTHLVEGNVPYKQELLIRKVVSFNIT